MGTRADFYAMSGDQLEPSDWIGSIAWDGYPDGIADAVLSATTEADYRAALTAFFAERDDVTMPERGWPWPWTTSDTSDYGYVFVPGTGVVFQDYYGEFRLPARFDEEADGYTIAAGASFSYPDMAHLKNVRFDGGSGLIVLTASPSPKSESSQ